MEKCFAMIVVLMGICLCMYVRGYFNITVRFTTACTLILFKPGQHTIIPLNQETLQAMYYLAHEPEIVAVTQLPKDQPGSPRKVVKALNKYARTYLLDVVAEYKIAPVSLTGLIPSTRISSLSWTKRPWTYSHSRRGPENSFQRVRM